MNAPHAWDGSDYQARFDALAAQGMDVHGEVRLLLSFGPTTVMDAGCGTGRVAIELARHGVDAVGVDVDNSMLETARTLAPDIRFALVDLSDPAFDLGLRFDVVVMAGNVPLFAAPGTQEAVVGGCARHLAPDGVLVSGFQIHRGYDLATYDAHCAAAGLALVERWSTWARDPLEADPTYAVSVHHRPVSAGRAWGQGTLPTRASQD